MSVAAEPTRPQPARFRSSGRPRLETTPGARDGRDAASSLERLALAGAELVRALEDAFDLDALERRLLAFAVHGEGLGAARAWLVHGSPARGAFVITSRRGADAGAPPLAEALQSPGIVPRDPGESAALAESALAAPLEAAWSRGAAMLAEVPSGGPAPWRGVVGAVPLRAGLRPYALLVMEWADAGDLEARRRDLATLQRLASRAAEALARTAVARRRVRQAEAVRELAHLAVSSVNLAEALRVAVRIAAHVTGARGSALWLGAGDALRLEATHGPAGRREAIARALEPAAARAARGGRAVVLEAGDAALAEAGEPLASLALLPLAAFGAVRGVLAVYDRAAAHPAGGDAFDRADREFLATLADLVAGLAAEAERHDQLRHAERRAREQQAELRRLERAAAAGERALKWMRDARGPLASIAAFARRMQRGLPEDHPHREYLEIVLREAEALERSGAEPAPAAPAEPALRVESLNAAVQEVLQESSERLVRRRIRLLKRLAPDLPALLMDPESLRRTLRNIVAQALDRVAVGGRIRVETRRAPFHVVVDVAHDGARHPGEMLEELFAPFAASGAGAAEPALALARRMVREHGGEVRLRSEGEWSAIVSLTIPIAENRDRRGAGGERRGPRTDRRRTTTPE